RASTTNRTTRHPRFKRPPGSAAHTPPAAKVYKHRHEPPRGRHTAGALDWGMGSVCCGPGRGRYMVHMRRFQRTQVVVRWGSTGLVIAVAAAALASRYYQFKLWRVSTFQSSGGVSAVGITHMWDLSRGNFAF